MAESDVPTIATGDRRLNPPTPLAQLPKPRGNTMTTSTNETTRERVFRIALDLFFRQGFTETGVAELAEASGIGKSALYHHIGSKEDALLEIVAQYLKSVLQDVEPIVAGDVPADAKLRQIAQQHMQTIADNLPAVVVFFRDGHALTGERRRTLVALRNRWEGAWSSVLQQGVEEGQFTEVSSVRVKGIVGMFSHSWLWFDPDGRLSAREIADDLVNVVLNGLRRPSGSQVDSRHHGLAEALDGRDRI